VSQDKKTTGLDELLKLAVKWGSMAIDAIGTFMKARAKGLSEKEIEAEIARIKGQEEKDIKDDWDVVNS